MQLSRPAWRVAGSALAWLVYAFSLTVLTQAALEVMGMGGFCASGGPYVIEDECSTAVAVLTPFSALGLFAAFGIEVVLARGFGIPLSGWGWSVLFGVLGAAFLVSSADPGGIVNLLVGLLFVAMALVPLVMLVRSEPRWLMLGTTTPRGERFAATADRPTVVPGVARMRAAAAESRRRPRAGDFAAAWAVFLVGAGLGVTAAVLLFRAVG